MTMMTTYKNALEALKNDRHPVIISNDDIILLKGAGGYTLVRNDLGKLQQTRYKTVNSIDKLEDDWVKEDTPVEYETFRYDEDASFYFRLAVTVAMRRDIVL